MTFWWYRFTTGREIAAQSIDRILRFTPDASGSCGRCGGALASEDDTYLIIGGRDEQGQALRSVEIWNSEDGGRLTGCLIWRSITPLTCWSG